MNNYIENREYSDGYTPALKGILLPFVREAFCGLLWEFQIEAATPEMDMREATDMVVAPYNIRIGCRVRKPHYWRLYPNQFTIRYPTEFEKVLNGYCDWMIYACAAQDSRTEIADWMIVNMHAFRYHWKNRDSYKYGIWHADRDNHDGTFFRAFSTNGGPGGFPDDWEILVGQSPKLKVVA